MGFNMEIVSKLVDIDKIDNLSAEYIEKELTKLNINPLRWAVVNVSDKILTVSVADVKNNKV